MTEVYAFPTSYAQERLWFLEQVNAGVAYSMPSAVRLRGQFDPAAFAEAIADLVRRHESLRTSFRSEGGRPVQVVHPSGAVRPTLVDVAADELDSLIRQEVIRPFDLHTPPLLRVTVYRLAPQEHVALFVMHHIISDGWSIGVMVREAAQAYAELAAGSRPSVPEPPIQYADYTLWQREWLESPAARAQLDYWRERLRDVPDTIDLPTDRPRPARPSFRGTRHRVAVGSQTTQRLRALGNSAGATLFMTLFAAFGVLLHRYSGQSDLAVGTMIANRDRAELERLFGFLANTLVLRLDAGGEPTFRELLNRARDVASDAYDHQDLPFDVLVERLRPQRDPSRNPLFQVMCVLQNAPLEWPDLAGLRIAEIELPIDSAKFDLLAEFTETADGLSLDLEYSSDLFDAATVRRMAEHLLVLLDSATTQPDVPIGRLPMLTPAEQAVPEVETAEWEPVAEAVARWALTRPEALAARWAEGSLTYRELSAGGGPEWITTVLREADLAGQAGRLCRELALRPGCEVAVVLPDGHPGVSLALGVTLLAGGCASFVPPDPAKLDAPVVYGSPGTLRTLVDRCQAMASPPGLRVALCGAGPVPSRLADDFALYLDCELLGVHPLASGEVLVARCRPGWPVPDLPLGRPVDPTRLVVRDRYGQPVPDGVYGELWLADGQSAGLTVRRRRDGGFELADGTAAWVDGVAADPVAIATALLADSRVVDVRVSFGRDDLGATLPQAWVVPAPDDPPSIADLTGLAAVDVHLEGDPDTGVLDVAVACWLPPDELREPLRYALTELGLPPRLFLVPAGHLLHRLRETGGGFRTGGPAVNVVAVRARDLVLGAPVDDLDFAVSLDRGRAGFVDALRVAVGRTSVPWIVLLGASPAGDDARAVAERASVRALAEELSGLPQVTVRIVTGTGLARDIATAGLGLGDNSPLAIVSDAAMLLRADCDELQRFLLAQRRRGVQVCVAGAGADSDVVAFFREHRAMPLALHHLTSWRLSWDGADVAVAELVAELGVPASRVLWLTSSAVWAAGVAAALPDLSVLRVPQEPGAAVRFLRGVPGLSDQVGVEA